MSTIKRNLLTIVAATLATITVIPAVGQSLTLDECYTLAEKNYPLVRQYELIEKSREYSLSNASKGALPQLTIMGQATYQSDVTKMPFEMPGMEIPTLSKDQYRVQGEVVQPLSDLFTTLKYKKEAIDAEANVERSQTDVEFHKVRERVNQLYFGILLIDAQIVQLDIMRSNIHSAMEKNRTAIENGVALKSSADLLKAELLKVNQKEMEMEAMRTTFLEMLSLFINREITEETTLQRPMEAQPTTAINRAELLLFDSQKELLLTKEKLVTAATLPRLNLFLQGGYGKPALNMLTNDFDYFYVGGIRLSWNISSLYTNKKERRLIKNNQAAVDLRKDLFLFNLNLNVTQQNSEIEKLHKIIESDREIIALRENIRRSAENQLQYGTITTNDFLISLNEEDEAKQNLIYHQMQQLAAQHNLKTTLGN